MPLLRSLVDVGGIVSYRHVAPAGAWTLQKPFNNFDGSCYGLPDSLNCHESTGNLLDRKKRRASFVCRIL